MPRGTTRNHVVVEETDGGLRLSLSAFLRDALGAPTRYVFQPTGAKLVAGLPLGRAYGLREACSIVAPLDCELLALDPASGSVLVRGTGVPLAEELLDGAGYAAYTATLPR